MPSASGKREVIRPLTTTRSAAKALMASGNGPHREPISVISLITKGDRSTGAVGTLVLFSTILPLGRTNRQALTKPSSLPEQSTTTSHSGLSPAERDEMGITDGLIRVSVGIENTGDLIEDFGQALGD